MQLVHGFQMGVAALLLGGVTAGGAALTRTDAAHQLTSNGATVSLMAQATPQGTPAACDTADPSGANDQQADPSSANTNENEADAGNDGQQGDQTGQQANDQNDQTDQGGQHEQADSTPGALNEGKDLLGQATITPDQAVQAAQAAASGTLGSVALEQSNGTLVFAVEVGGQDVLISAADGSVIAVQSGGLQNGPQDGAQSGCGGND